MIKQKKSIFFGTFLATALAFMLLTVCWNLLFSSIDGLRSSSSDTYIGSISIFGTLSGLTVFAALFVIIGTTSFSIQQRYGEIALLRGIGLTPGQIKRLIAGETNILSVVGCIFGAPLGLLLAPSILRWFIAMGAVPSQIPYSVKPLSMLMVFGIGWIILHIASFFTIHNIAKKTPTQAVRDSIRPPKQTGVLGVIFGSIFTLGAVAILIFVPQEGAAGVGYNFLASLCFLIGVTTLGTLAVKLISIPIRGLFTVFGPIGYLALENSKIYSKQQANAALGITLIIALNGGILINSLAMNEASQNEKKTYYQYNTEIVASQGFSQEQLQNVQELFDPSLYDVTLETEVTYHWDSEKKPAKDDYHILGILGKYQNNTLSISERFAKKHSLDLGNAIEITFPNKETTTLTITEIHARKDFDGVDLLTSYELVEQRVDSKPLRSIVIQKEESLITEQLHAYTDRWHNITINPSKGKLQEDENARMQRAVIYMMILISLSFSVIAVINTFSITLSARRASYRELWLIGITEKQITRMLHAESSITIVSGVLLGAIINAACIGTFQQANFSNPNLWGDGLLFFGLIGLGTLVGSIGSTMSISREVPRSIGVTQTE